MDNNSRKTNFDSQESAKNSINSLTQENVAESNAIQIPGISLPKGGGALKGIDEKFEVNAANGTAAFNIPLPVTSGRNGFSPALTLSYNSGGGNSPYGLGWSLDFPSIQRKTDKRLPRYRDGIEEDVFMFSGAEDLVPFLTEVTPGDWQISEYRDQVDDKIKIKRYRPRIEGSFARIEKISHPVYGVYWKVTTRENVVTIFGRDANARIADPGDETRIFQWLPEFSYDDKGNWIKYEYKAENLDNVPGLSYENNHLNGMAGFTNKYLKRIQYGNRNPYYADPGKPYDPQTPADNEHFFEVVFDYGEHDASSPTPDEVPGQLWQYRPDAFSNYRPGFEIRTNRLCKRVLMFHRFEELGDEPCLVRSLDFQYAPSSINQSGQAEVTYLESVTQSGYIRIPGNTYSRKSLPPMEFEYQRLNWDKEIKTVTRENIVNAPVGLTNNYQWVDLYGEGIPGILTEQGQGWYYKSNLGDIDEHGDVSFTAAKKVFPRPSFVGISSGVLSIQDLEANGQKQVVVNSPGIQGYFQLTMENDWEPFRAFEARANIDLQDPNLRLIDLNGDGQPELVVSEDNVFVWYEADGKQGHKAAEFAAKTFDEDKGPAIVFADREQTIFLADMSGDGMTDIVRIRSGEICYWANMGYGRFSAKVNMSNAPRFDHPDLFNPQYLHLADVSGTGATDIIYLGKNKFKAYINLSGNAWSEPHEIEPFFPIDGNTRLAVIDLLGTGTSCIAWSSDLPAFAQAPMRYIDLMGGKKPHVLVHYQNNFGKETTLEYKSSTHYYLLDKLAGKPWITKLPFPVQVVSKLIVEEKISYVRFTNEYRYHHGYYDHPEREFRGFGLVEQLDSEHYETWNANNAGNQLEKSAELYQKPVLTKTWYHTGAFLDKERILTQFKEEYWYEEYNREFPEAPLNITITEPALKDARVIAAENIRDSAIIDKLDGDQWREVLRACKGMVLRQEVFALDAPAVGADDSDLKKQMKPYTAAAHNCNIQLLQPGAGNPYGVFLVTESEAITFHYERDETDPRIAHNLNIKLDEYGNVLESAAVVYPRQDEFVDASLPDDTQQAQNKTTVIYTQNQFTNDVIGTDDYRLPLPSEVKTYELKGVAKAIDNDYYTVSDFDKILDDSIEVPYHQVETDPASGTSQKRLIEHIRTLYYKDDLSGALDLHQLESKGLPFESYQLAYTPALISDIYGTKVNAVLMQEGKFTHSKDENGLEDDNWWIPSGIMQFIEGAETVVNARDRFYSPISYTDPYGAKTKVKYYSDYFLFIEETEDALGNKAGVERFDFRTLSPRRMKDANNNISEAISDELGLVKAMALLGKGSEADDLTGLDEFSTPLENDLVTGFFNAPTSSDMVVTAKNLLRHATTRFVYDFDVYKNSGKPVVVAAINRETHHAHLAAGEQTKLQFAFEYSDGLGNVAMTKVQAEPGPAKQVIVNPDGTYTVSQIDTAALDPKQLRWIGSGRTILNNKGNAVKQYEPYFSITHRYEDLKELVETGVTPIMYYDAMGRLIKTEMPNKTFSKVEFDAWKQVYYDPNDTVKESQWYNDRINHLIDAELIAAGKDPAKEKDAADKAAKHADTPGVVHLDTLGRPILSIDHNRDNDDNDEFYHTRVKTDIEGNPRSITDARNNVVMHYKYNMQGNKVYQNSMDAGQRWLFSDIVGTPLRTWDERDHEFQYFYDILHRPIQSKVIGGDGSTPLDHIFDRIFYGEAVPYPEQKNLRGQVVKHYDTGGLIETPEYDFKGQPKSTTRKLYKNYKTVANWIDANLDADLEADSFTFITETDALGRITKQTAPDGSIITPSYSEAGLLNAESVKHLDSSIPTTYIKDIDYNEKGQREKIIYGNDVYTQFYYDKETFRLKRLETKRQNNDQLQDWYYTFDPVGNITHIEDKNIPEVFFDNQKITGVSIYTYDALYRLKEATGRENGAVLLFNDKDNWNDAPFMHQLNTGDPMVMRNYTQQYQYDAVGNILQMQHIADTNNWTRNYQYQGMNNRLTGTQVGTHGYSYPHHPQHGFMIGMPHLQVMNWNFKEELQAAARQHVVNGTPEATYYQYDGQGQRIRKITENQADADSIPTKKEERIYIAGYELYKKHSGTHADLQRISLSLMDEEHRFVMIETRNDVNDGTEKRIVRYQLHNHLGSASLELDGTTDAKVISYEEYHPYGTTAYQAKNATIKSAAKRYRYTGKERDEESGFYYHGARYYAPWLGRWIAPDPAGLVDGVNVYVYVSNNPVMKIDPRGMNDEKTEHLSLVGALEIGPCPNYVPPPTQASNSNKNRGYYKLEEMVIEGRLDDDQRAGFEQQEQECEGTIKESNIKLQVPLIWWQRNNNSIPDDFDLNKYKSNIFEFLKLKPRPQNLSDHPDVQSIQENVPKSSENPEGTDALEAISPSPEETKEKKETESLGEKESKGDNKPYKPLESFPPNELDPGLPRGGRISISPQGASIIINKDYDIKLTLGPECGLFWALREITHELIKGKSVKKEFVTTPYRFFLSIPLPIKKKKTGKKRTTKKGTNLKSKKGAYYF
jgi:RHS repeat-associated protein